VGDAVAIPPGAFLQGKVDKLARNGGRGELRLQSMTLTLPDGEVVPIAGPLNLESADGYAVPDATSGRSAAVFLLPLAGAGLGALIGHSAAGQPTTVNGLTVNPNRLRDTGIGTLVGAGLGAIASFAMIGTSRSFFLDTGTPADLVLPQPLSVGPGQVAAGMPSKSPPVQAVAPPPSANPNIAGCSARQESCHGSCVDTITFMNDSNNCGRCGNICSVGETCTGGSCSCGPGYSSCMGSCISDAALMSDNNNCGRCGNSCSIGQTCMGGTCTRTTPCAPGDLSCR